LELEAMQEVEGAGLTRVDLIRGDEEFDVARERGFGRRGRLGI
jgi:hypothetical protein